MKLKEIEKQIEIIKRYGIHIPERIDTYKHKEKVPQRNEPCPCNSGKKYKKCCLTIKK